MCKNWSKYLCAHASGALGGSKVHIDRYIVSCVTSVGLAQAHPNYDAVSVLGLTRSLSEERLPASTLQ